MSEDYLDTTGRGSSSDLQQVKVDVTHCINQSEHSVGLEQVQKTSVGVAFLLALILNGFLLGTLLNMSRARHLNRMHRMIVHLTCADLFVAFGNILPHVFIIHQRGVIYGGPFVCGFVPYVQVLAMYSSSYVLIAASIDRHLAICHPLRFHASIVARQPFLIGAAWVASSILAIPQTLVLTSTPTSTTSNSDGVQPAFCSYIIDGGLPRAFYTTYYAVTIYLAPVLIIGVLNARICLVVWRNSAHAQPEVSSKFPAEEVRPLRNRSEKTGNEFLSPVARMEGEREESSSNLPRMHLQRMSQAKVKTVKLTLAIVVSYFLCWGPFFVCSILVAWDPCRFNQASVADRALVVLIMDLASLNSCVNPFICLVFNKHIRDHVTCRQANGMDTTAVQSTNFASSLRSTHHAPSSQSRRSSYPARKTSAAIDFGVFTFGGPVSMETQRLRTSERPPRLSC